MKILAMISMSCIALLTACQAPLGSFPVSNQNYRSILILPVVNETTEALAGEGLPASLSVLLSERGYYVLPSYTVKTVLESEGLYEPEKIQQEKPSEFAKLFGADVIIYACVKKWQASYGVLATETYGEVQYNCFNADGEQLFSNTYHALYTPQGNTNSLAEIIAQMISSAIERADPSYELIASMVNEQAVLNNFAFGPYRQEQQK